VNAKMFTDYAALDNYVSQPKISLSSIWLLNADDTYDITRRGAAPGGMGRNELICIRTVAGKGIIALHTGRTLEVCGESLLVVRNRDILRYRCDGGNWQFWWTSFLTDSEELFPLNETSRAGLMEDEKKRIYECLNLLGDDNIWKQRTACALFSQLLFQWMNNQQLASTPPFKNEDVITHACNYMKMNLDKPLQVSDIAKMCGFCENQFRNLFIRKYKTSPKKYILMLRINAAKALLMQTSLTIADIALRLGYSSQFHLTKEFKRLTGRAPSQFRASPSAGLPGREDANAAV
jgi:AraC-like DNA-binding protein